MTNDQKQHDPMVDAPEMETDLDRAIRELDRFRRPEAWAAVPPAASADATSAAPAAVATAAVEITEAIPEAASEPLLAATDVLEDEAVGRSDSFVDDDNDDDLFAPEPSIVQPQSAAQPWHDDSPSAPAPAVEALYTEDAPAQPATDSGDWREPEAEVAASRMEPPLDEGPVAKAPVSEADDFAAADDRRARMPSDFDDDLMAQASEPDAAGEQPLPQAAAMQPVFADAPMPGYTGDPFPAQARDIASTPEAEEVSLPRRMFGLKRALDAHRLGVSVDDLPGDPATEARTEFVPEFQPVEAFQAASEPEAERKGWFGSWRRRAEPEFEAPVERDFEAPPMERTFETPFAAPEPRYLASEPEATAEPEPQAWADPAPEPEPWPEPAPEPEARVESEPEPEPAAWVAPEPEPEPEPQAWVAPEPEPEALAEPEPVAAAKSEPEPDRRTVPEPELMAEPLPPADTLAAIEPQPEPQATAEREPEPEARVESERKPAFEPRGWFGSRRGAEMETPEAGGAPAAAAVAAAAAAAAASQAGRTGWFGARRKAEPAMTTAELEPVSTASPEPTAAAAPQAERKGWFRSRKTEGAVSARAQSAPVSAPPVAPAPEPVVPAAPQPERKGWFRSRKADAAAPPLQPESISSPPVAPAPEPVAATAPQPERKGWFGRKKAEVAPSPAQPEPVAAAAAAPPVEPPAKAARRGWFGSRKTSQAAAAATELASESPRIDASAAATPTAPEVKPEDPFAAMTAAIAPKVKREGKGWFAKSAPASDAADAAPSSSSPMVDLAPVREALQAAALQRGGSAAIALTGAAAGLSGEAPAASPAEAGRVGVLLVNLGTPDAPKAKAVRRYLREFLSDRRVIEKDSFTWQLVFRGIILPFRPRSKARAYKAIWNKERNESPLKTITRSQAEKLGQAVAGAGSDAIVDWAMRYGNPSMESRIKALVAQGCERILLVPLYPQYSSATTATVCDEAFRVLSRLRNQPSLRIAPPYYAEPMYIEAIASSIEAELSKLSFEPEVILASYHGMPLEYVQKGDPYQRQCVRTTDLLRERLNMSQSNFVMTFQSRFGRAEWLQPYTDVTLRKLAKDGVKNVAVVTPGFVADCLETLEEIAIENAHVFKKRGGKNFAFIPCLNDSERGMLVIREIAARELQGWV